MKSLVLAGGFPQIALIEELHKRECYVLLADYNENPVAKKYADSYFQVSTLDADAIKNIAKEEHVDFLITACTDQALLTVAKVSEELGLPCYIDYQTALNVTNKQYMKEMFEKNKIPTAKHVILDKYDSKAIESMQYPLIVKPVDCNSSKGVRRCENDNELKKFLDEAIKYSRTKTAVVEEYIDGDELTVDVYVENGIANVLSISNSIKIKEKDKFVIFRTINPAAVSESVVKQVNIIAQQIVDAFHLSNSPMLIQILTDGKKAYVIEFSARTGGGVKYLLIKHASGFDVIKAIVDLTLGIKPHYKKSDANSKYLVNDFIYCKKGVYDHLDGFEELKKSGIIKDYYVFGWKGNHFTGELKASGDRVGGYTVVADTQEELVKKHNEARKHIKVMNIQNEDIARHDILSDLYFENGYIYSK